MLPEPTAASQPSGTLSNGVARAGLGILAAGFGLAAMAWAFQPGSQPGFQGVQDPSQASRVTTLGGGVSADSNRDMIAVTGVDVTGVSVLYLIDTKSKHLAVYQASGGSGGTQGVKLVGARDISLDLQLEGFNDKTEYKGRPLRFKDLEKRFSGLESGGENPSSED